MMTKLCLKSMATALAAWLCLTGSAFASITLSDGTATGQWYDPNRNGEGFFVEVVGEGDGQQIAVSMYSFDENGNQLWFTGSIGIGPNDIGAVVPVIAVEGPGWGSAFDPADGEIIEAGTITVQFPSCSTALFRVDSDIAALEDFSYSLVRLTTISGMECVDRPTQSPDDSGVTSGLWVGSGGCFFVNNEGTAIVESDLCDEGKALSGETPGVEVDLDGEYQPDDCQANVVCNGAWSINFDNASGTPAVSCPGTNDAAGVIFFESSTQARVEVWEDITGDFLACYGTFNATPSE